MALLNPKHPTRHDKEYAYGIDEKWFKIKCNSDKTGVVRTWLRSIQRCASDWDWNSTKPNPRDAPVWGGQNESN